MLSKHRMFYFWSEKLKLELVSEVMVLINY